MSRKAGLLSQYKGLRKEIYILCIGRIVTSLGSMVYPMLTLILSSKMGMDATSISVMVVASSILMLPANLIGGKIADKYDKRRIIIWCDLVSIVSFIVCGLIPLSYFTIALMVFAGIFQSIEGPAYTSLTADLTTTKDRERAYSLGYLAMNLGMVLSPTLAGMLFNDYLWLSFIISGVSIGISTLLIFLFVRDITPEKEDGEEASYQASRENESIWRILRDNPIVVLFIVISSLYYGAYGQYTFLMPLDMSVVHGANGAMIFGSVSSLNCIVVVLFTPVITRILIKLPETKKMLCGQFLLAVGYAIFLLLIGHIPFYYVAMILFTWGEIVSTLAEGPYLSRRIPASHRGRISGASAVLGTLITGVTDISIGAVYDRLGSIGAWTIVLSLLGAAAALTVVLIVRDKKRYPKLYDAGAAGGQPEAD